MAVTMVRPEAVSVRCCHYRQPDDFFRDDLAAVSMDDCNVYLLASFKWDNGRYWRVGQCPSCEMVYAAELPCGVR